MHYHTGLGRYEHRRSLLSRRCLPLKKFLGEEVLAGIIHGVCRFPDQVQDLVGFTGGTVGDQYDYHIGFSVDQSSNHVVESDAVDEE